MPRTVRPATRDNAVQLNNAIAFLKRARQSMRAADCPQAMAAINSAIKSAEGARRHMGRRLAAAPDGHDIKVFGEQIAARFGGSA